ncbi:MAG TPA: pilus assembly PilX N-terminal domain-containing protein [Ramlibacter sp.]|nr:pilus assembly PilX N-terminal domain-containing protein [Ramlibacter sp.]
MKAVRQSGMTLIVALVMLIVLSLLVVSAIRFSNINLKIAGNVQSETEATAAAQLALETTVKEIIGSSNIATIAAQPEVTVSTGGTSYKVAVSAPSCIFTKNINNNELDPTKSADQVCFEGTDTERLVDASGNLTTTPTACRDQQWDVQAAVNDTSSGAKVTVLQGIAVRVGAQVSCP